MTVQELKKQLNYFPRDAHVVLTLMPDGPLVVPRDGRKFDVKDVWEDGARTVNLIATTPADTVDPNLRNENGL